LDLAVWDAALVLPGRRSRLVVDHHASQAAIDQQRQKRINKI
jgi:hypothetical protein